jgi:hypothetical protein
MSKKYTAKVTVEFIIPDICDQEDLDVEGWTFEKMVRYEIEEEGLFSIAEENQGRILKIEKVEEPDMCYGCDPLGNQFCNRCIGS